MRTRADKSAIIRIKLRMAGVSRRGEGGWDVDGWALVVARRSPLPGLDIAVPQTGFPTHGRPQGPHPYPTPLPPLRETRRLTIFSFLLLLRLMRIRADKSAPTLVCRLLFHTPASVSWQESPAYLEHTWRGFPCA